MKIMNFSVIFYQVGRLNGPTLEPNVIGLVEIHPLFTRRMSEFGPSYLDRLELIGLTSESNICTAIALMQRTCNTTLLDDEPPQNYGLEP